MISAVRGSAPCAWPDDGATAMPATSAAARKAYLSKLIVSPVEGLQIQHQPSRVFQNVFHLDQERHRLAAVDDTVIVGQREIHHRPYLDLAGNHHRPLLNLVHAENAGLRRVE